jgi:DUF4097 and DUF4098 domain-containing protein YvlB
MAPTMQVMRNARPIVLLSSVVCLLSSPSEARSQSERIGRRIDSTFAVGRNAWVDVSINSGMVIITGWTKPEARVTGRIESGTIEADLSSTRVGVFARPDRNRNRNSRPGESHFEINVPIGTRVMVTSSGGDIRVLGTLAEVQATASGGDIEVVDASDRISVQTVGGDIRVEKARGRTDIGTTGGDVELYDIVGPLTVRSVSSDLVVRRVESSDVRINTTSGDITYEGTVEPKGVYDINAHSGDVVFTIPTGTGASLSLQTYNGDIDNAFPMTLMPGSNIGRRRGRMEFDIGGGGARISVVTFSGDITIARGPAPRPKPEE